MTRLLNLRVELEIPGGTVTLAITDLDLVALDEEPRAALVDLISGMLGAAQIEPTPAPDPEPEPKNFRVEATPAPRASRAHGEGSTAWALLTAVADQGGTWEGSVASLGATVERGTVASNSTVCRRLVADGLLTVDRRNATRISGVALTRAGWDHLGRRPTSGAIGGGQIMLTPPPATTENVDMSAPPMERRGPVDVDAARARAASASW